MEVKYDSNTISGGNDTNEDDRVMVPITWYTLIIYIGIKVGRMYM